MCDLALQVGEVHRIRIDEREAADARAGEEQGDGRAEPAGTDHERARGAQALLAFDAYLVEEDVARVAQQVVVGHGASVAGNEKRRGVRGVSWGSQRVTASTCRPACARRPSC
jgi:hypothetical protein